jgi:hypothetical protein
LKYIDALIYYCSFDANFNIIPFDANFNIILLHIDFFLQYGSMFPSEFPTNVQCVRFSQLRCVLHIGRFSPFFVRHVKEALFLIEHKSTNYEDPRLEIFSRLLLFLVLENKIVFPLFFETSISVIFL